MNKEIDAQAQKSLLCDHIYDIALSNADLRNEIDWEDSLLIGTELHKKGFFKSSHRQHGVRYLQNSPIDGVRQLFADFTTTEECDAWINMKRPDGYEITVTQHISRPVGEWVSEMDDR